ncbi:MAG: DUF3021 domain-containing protein [Oscillospiraceae bacterium]|nr:DUF3021 domain-containing protein [Oscillospiraceae bacterium]
MKKHILEFLRRGLTACGFGPLVLAVLYLILHRTASLEVLTVRQVCAGIFSLSALAFLAGGMNMLYQIERLPLSAAILIHGSVLYCGYLGVYLLNGWLQQGTTPILVFSGIFVLGYLAIWGVIYSITRRKTNKLNEMLKQTQQKDKCRENPPIREAFLSEVRDTTEGKAPVKRMKWMALAACLVAVVVIACLCLPMLSEKDTPIPTTEATETHFTERYLYFVDKGPFAAYVGGKVIAEERLGDKLEEVTLTAGWQNNQYEWLTQESLRGELYLIRDVPKEVAVALKFLDKGDALTTTHYYVLLNPEADLTPVEEYVIGLSMPRNATEDPNTEDEYAIGFTSSSNSGEE